MIVYETVRDHAMRTQPARADRDAKIRLLARVQRLQRKKLAAAERRGDAGAAAAVERRAFHVARLIGDLRRRGG